MDRLTELRDTVAYLQGELQAIHEGAADRSLTEDETARFNDGVFVRDAAIAEGIELEARATALAKVEAGDLRHVESSEPRQAPAFIRDVDPYDERTQREVGTREAAKRAIGECRHIDGDGKTEAERKLNLSVSDPNLRNFDEYLLVHNSDAYSRGFFKLMSGRSFDLEDDEKHAIRAAQAFDTRYGYTYDEERGVTLTAANGGALIPAHLDPTVILTNAGTKNAIRQISRVVSVTSNVWNGVTSAGITLAWTTEGGDSSDIAPTFASPSITCYKAAGTVPITIEAFEDIDGIGSEIASQLQDAKDRFDAAAFVSGTGSAQPFGVVTALFTETARWESHATNSVFSATDLIDAQNMLGARWQDGASWLGSLAYHNRVRAMGTDYYGQTVTLDNKVSGSILGQPAYQASDMSTALSTATNPAFVYGNFDNYVIADRVGMGVEFVPHLFSAGNALPNGRRGWYVHYRMGADVVNNTAFVLSVNPGA